MTNSWNFEYYYGDESEQFSFLRIPRQLITGTAYKKVSVDAKLLYGLMLDRMGLSARNGWYDEQGRVYIYFTAAEIRETLCCGNDKALKLLAELDTKKGVGLIERVKQGQGKPTKIYVKRFTSGKVPEASEAPAGRGADHHFPEDQTKEKSRSGSRKSRGADLEKTDTSYTDKNDTDFIYTNPSIYPSKEAGAAISQEARSRCCEAVKRNIDYSTLCRQYGKKGTDGVAELIADILCGTRPAIRIGGRDIPTEEVCRRFAALRYRHLEYVFECLRRNEKPIRNIRSWLLTALYNAIDRQTAPGENVPQTAAHSVAVRASMEF